jgi:hypothetical protein
MLSTSSGDALVCPDGGWQVSVLERGSLRRRISSIGSLSLTEGSKARPDLSPHGAGNHPNVPFGGWWTLTRSGRGAGLSALIGTYASRTSPDNARAPAATGLCQSERL